MAPGANTPRSRSRSKRSTTNLADLRLAPLSTKYEASRGDGPLKSPLRTPYDADSEADYARRHPSYLQGQSAPTTPGILSRTNSKRHLGGGLSRRGSLYDHNNGEDADTENDAPLSYTSSGPARDSLLRADITSGQIPKAKSEATLLHADTTARKALHRLSGPGVPLAANQQQQRNRYQPARGRRSGAATPTQRNHNALSEPDSWLTHTSAMTSALVREDKGQSWITTRQSSTSLAPPTDSEDDDSEDEGDNYEEMAALAASTAKMQDDAAGRMYAGGGGGFYGGYDGGSPVSTRQSRGSVWGSRYGSRPTSTRTSRLASPVGTRTPRRRTSDQSHGYFDQVPRGEEEERRQEAEREDDTEDDEQAIARLSQAEGFGLGNVVDRVMNFHLFGGVQHEGETTDDDNGGYEGNQLSVNEGESVEEAKKRMERERERRKGEKEMLTKQPAPAPLGDGKGKGEVSAGWQDASWLLSVAAKALF
ncbi:hypothetical protein Slin15195_G116550 [Septoria linicola]|uniref:Uncharacterized protein n=1 Tax=Septoria linicola TaxID=215465 RepID=A0A9Q9EP07_9PEZI|nr:hypothetical protein Slin14017_G093550 [Septoria linicola]USW58336.1 hypothetical protein Slin15195_G116550 [Septoria linicola]